IKAGDLNSICRRLLVIASEDIGLAYPQAISLVKSCTDAALQLGFPEARIPLAQATILLANSPKSNSAYLAINEALKDIDSGNVGQIPLHLRDAHYKAAKELNRGVEYKYPHDYPKNYVYQQY
ncbi:AAA family ATPase, partial [Acinetobacter baumannii]